MLNSLFEDELKKSFAAISGKSVLVAFSGGKDSLALLNFLNDNKNKTGCIINVCHVNHGLRAESFDDESFCRVFCEDRGLAFFAVNVSESIMADGCAQGVEDAARRYRYKALDTVTDEVGADFILTAHTFDDRIESFFTDLYTGASVFTIPGVPEFNGRIYRPMLNIRTSQIEDYLRRKALTPVYDRSNSDERFVRNRMRHSVLPHLYAAGRSFEQTVVRLQSESAKLDSFFRSRVMHAVITENDDMTVLDRQIFETFHEIEREYLLGKLFSGRFRVSKSMIGECLNLFLRNGSRRVDLPGGYVFEVSYHCVRFFKKSLLQLFYVEKESGIDTINLYDFMVKFSGRFVAEKLIIRTRVPGDRFMGRKLKDIFIDKKIDQLLKDTAVVIESNAKIVWVEYISDNTDTVSVERMCKW